jgi:hypothetical protein
MRLWQFQPILVLSAILAIIPWGGPITTEPVEVPVVDAGLGSCRADFNVKDGAAKAVFNAKINLRSNMDL